MQLKDRVAIVTGGGNGIGRAIALRFAAEGASVTVAELEEEGGRDTVKSITESGGRAIFHQTDTADSESVRAMVEATVEKYGTVNVLVNNAAAFVFGKVEEVTQSDRHIASLGLDPEAAYAEFGKDALMNRMGRPEEIAAGALFLASHESSFMTGAHIVIDGGATID